MKCGTRVHTCMCVCLCVCCVSMYSLYVYVPLRRECLHASFHARSAWIVVAPRPQMCVAPEATSRRTEAARTWRAALPPLCGSRTEAVASVPSAGSLGSGMLASKTRRLELRVSGAQLSTACQPRGHGTAHPSTGISLESRRSRLEAASFLQSEF